MAGTKDIDFLSHELTGLFMNRIVIRNICRTVCIEMSTWTNLQSTCLIYVKKSDLSWPDKIRSFHANTLYQKISTWSILRSFFHVWRVNKLNAILYLKMCFDSFRASFSTRQVNFQKWRGFTPPLHPLNHPPYLHSLPFPVAITSPTVTLMINTGSCTAPSLASRSYCGVMPLLVLISCRKLMGVLPGGISAI